VIVEHDVSMMMSICEKMHVLNFGHLIAAGTPLEVRNDRNVQAAYLGSA
jgi:branched-chain amino acid transport system ATP-binding protein